MRSCLRRARGFALVLALFLILLLGAVAAYMLTVSNVQVETGIMDEQSSHAYQAARAGLDWGAYRVLRDATCPAGTTTIAFPTGLPAHLAGFHAEVTCTAFGTETEGAATVTTYRIVSTGCNAIPCGSAPGPAYVERQLHLNVAR